MTPKLVIFDLDGLMIDSESAAFEVWRQVFSERFGRKLALDEYVEYIGQTGERIRSLLAERYPDLDCAGAMDEMGEMVFGKGLSGELPPKKGLYELLDALDALKIKYCVASSSDRDYVTAALNGIGALDRVAFAVCGDEVTRSKPDPEIFLKCVTRCSLSPSECLVLEDSNAGILCAQNAGIPVIAVRDLKEPDPELKKGCLDVVDSLLDVIPYLN